MVERSRKALMSTDGLYQTFFSDLLANDDGIDAEFLTQSALSVLGFASCRRNWLGISSVLQRLANDLQTQDPRLEQMLFGCRFSNPIGLAAGFDKNGLAASIWDSFGFAFAELGTVTWHPQVGNPKPRLFRLSKENAALNRMGFNNHGAEVMKRTLEKQKLKSPGQRASVIGLNLGKSKITSLEDARGLRIIP